MKDPQEIAPAALRHFLSRLCNAAEAETLPRFRRAISVENKLDAGYDPVTEADREAEAAIRALIGEEFPEHDIVGEEHGTTGHDARYRWIIDPIDGTRAFVCGIPVWGTLIGLYRDGIPLAGVMDQPFTGERYMAFPAADGLPGETVLVDRQNGEARLTTSATESLADARLMTTSPHLLRNGRDEAYFKLEEQVRLFRYGCDCYAYALLAAGHIDLVAESGLNVYDIAALIPIIENAGGVVSSWDGGSAADGGSILASANPALHEQAIAALAK